MEGIGESLSDCDELGTELGLEEGSSEGSRPPRILGNSLVDGCHVGQSETEGWPEGCWPMGTMLMEGAELGIKLGREEGSDEGCPDELGEFVLCVGGHDGCCVGQSDTEG